MASTEEVEDMRDSEFKELKEGIKELHTLLIDVDKTVTVHTEKFSSLGNIKEMAERTSESAKSAHKRIDKVQEEFRADIDAIRESQQKQYEDFKNLVQTTNKAHEDNFKNMKTFAWKVFFMFATPVAVGVVGLLFVVFNKGLGLK